MRIELPLPHDVFHFHHQRPAHQIGGARFAQRCTCPPPPAKPSARAFPDR